MKGKVLDVGCGAGRVALYLQGWGLDVVGVDNSPFALRVARLRGVRNTGCWPSRESTSSLGRLTWW
ncbi:MAG: class I SAM-dependent methyltransferase [Nitrososphaerota archaeon]|nr:class I SAM-dependent methyltransferase [Nitrososphaerota archaeon]